MNEVTIPLKISGIAQMKAELRELKGEIANATDPAQMTALAQRAGEVADRLKDANEQVAVFTAGSKFESISNSLAGVRGDLASLDFEGANEKAKVFAKNLGSLKPADISKGFKDFTATVGTLGKAFLKLGAQLLVNPIFLMVAVVVAVTLAFTIWEDELGKFGIVLKVAFAGIYLMVEAVKLLIQGFKDMTDWLGLTSFAAEDNAARSLAANEKVSESSKNRTAIVTADLGREIAEAKAAGKDTTKLEEERSNVQIKEANKRRNLARKALADQRKLGEDADQETIKKLKQQITEETELIKQGYSDKKVARLNDIAEAEADAEKAAEKAKAQADKWRAADKASEDEIATAAKIVSDSKKTAQQIEIDDLKADYAIKIATAIKYKNDTIALIKAQKIQEAAIIKKYDDEAKAKKAENDAKAAAFTEDFAKTLGDKLAKISGEYGLTEEEAADLRRKKEIKAAKQYYDELAIDADSHIGKKLGISKIEEKIENEKLKTLADIDIKYTDAKIARDNAALQAKKSIIASEIDAAKGLVNLLAGLGEKNKKVQKAALIANAALSIAEIINNTNVGSAKEVATKGVIGLGTSALLYTKMAISIASVVAATAKGLSALGGGSVTAPSNTGGGGGGGDTSTTAVAPTTGPNLFGQANTGSQVNAGGNSNQNITVTAIVSETEITASQQHINNIQQNSVL
jgi:hypothetical protein